MFRKTFVFTSHTFVGDGLSVPYIYSIGASVGAIFDRPFVRFSSATVILSER